MPAGVNVNEWSVVDSPQPGSIRCSWWSEPVTGGARNTMVYVSPPSRLGGAGTFGGRLTPAGRLGAAGGLNPGIDCRSRLTRMLTSGVASASTAYASPAEKHPCPL